MQRDGGGPPASPRPSSRGTLLPMVCRLCGGTSTTPFLARGIPYASCPSCGYIGMASSHFPNADAERNRYLLHRNELADPGYRAYLSSFLERLSDLRPGLRILDFGSGPNPALTVLLRERGCSVRIYDPYFAPGRAWKRYHYDLIVLHEVAEHLRHPRRTLETLRRSLGPGGILAIRTRFAPEDENEFARWWYREDPTHVGFFRERSLAALSRLLGLELRLLEAPDMALFAVPQKPEDRAEQTAEKVRFPGFPEGLILP